MKTVVTGGNGFIGSHLVKKLLDEGRDVIVVVKHSNNIDNLINLGIKPSYIELRPLDLIDYKQTLAAIVDADSVFHLAARIGNIVYLHGTQMAELEGLQTNLLIDANVFRACVEIGVKRIIYTSSCAVYPIYKQLTSGTILKEDDFQIEHMLNLTIKPMNVQPDGGYGWAKLLGEMQLGWIKGIRIGIARIFNVYGVNESIDTTAHVMGDLIKRAIVNNSGDFIIHGNGKQTRDFLYVTDCVEALLALEKLAKNPPLTVNIASGKAVTISELVKEVIKLSGKEFNLVYDTTKLVGPISRTADITKTKLILNWKPKISLEKGISQTYEWAESKLTR